MIHPTGPIYAQRVRGTGLACNWVHRDKYQSMKSPTLSLATSIAILCAMASINPLKAITLYDGVTYSQNFSTLPIHGISYTDLPSEWFFIEEGIHGDIHFDNGPDQYGSADTYSLGGSENALVGSSNGLGVIPIIGAYFTNGLSTGTIDVSIAYTGEQWRLGTLGTQQHVDFQYSTNATTLTNGTWIDFDPLDLHSSVNSGETGILNGNAESNKTAFSGTIKSVEVASGDYFMIRWNYGSMTNGDQLGIDDFSIVAIPEPSPVFLSLVALCGLFARRSRH